MIEWIQNNWQTVTAGAGATVMLARVIVKLTPTPVDDGWLARIVSFLKAVGLKID